ncbi:unnamed protein product [Ixodes hexagonus]
MEAETHPEKDCSALGGLFQYIINDLKGGAPVWEDFLAKATKLHSQLKMTASVSAAFLDSFQKVADMATNTKGATKEVGKALTRLCLRHRSVEAKLKSFTASIMDHLVLPLQDKMEDWKKMSVQLDKDHSKEFKRARQEIKKMSTDTLRLQKKVKKGGRYETQLDCALQDVSDKYLLLEETEKQAVRRALIEERSRFCLLVACLRPVVREELLMLHEIAHLEEIVDSLARLTADPQRLPSASEQQSGARPSVLSGAWWLFQTPPSSPSSLGSRKSSMCSISSFNSSSSGSTKSHSPRSFSQLLLQRLANASRWFSSVSSLRPTRYFRSVCVLKKSALVFGARFAMCFRRKKRLDWATILTDGSVVCAVCVLSSLMPTCSLLLDVRVQVNAVFLSSSSGISPNGYERCSVMFFTLFSLSRVCPVSDLLSPASHSSSPSTRSTGSGAAGLACRRCGGAGTHLSSTCSSLVRQSPITAKGLSTPTPSRGPARRVHKQKSGPDMPYFTRFRPRSAVLHEENLQYLPIIYRRPILPPLSLPPQSVGAEASPSSLTGNMEASSPVQARDGDAVRLHEAYKTYSPSSASTRYEGLSGSSTLPAKSSTRRGSQPPPPPPIRRTPSISSSQGSSAASPQHPQVAADAADGSGGDGAADECDSRAKLIQALNARFSKPSPLEQAGLRFSLAACRAEDGSDLPLPDPPLVDAKELDHQDGSFPDPPPPPEQAECCVQPRKQVHPEKKLLRAHTIGYSERDALIQSLNAKFCMTADMQSTAIRKCSLHEGMPPGSASMVHRTPRTTNATDQFRANLEQTLLKHESNKKSGTEPAESRRSRSVGPTSCGSSAEQRQFLNTLNARLAEQRNNNNAAAAVASTQSSRRGSLQPDAEFGTRRKSADANRASRVQTWLAGRGSVDMTACRESLLDQIRKGTALKRVSSQSDRSTPRLL